MPRLPRLQVEGYPYHCIARGNNRQAVFFCDDDYLFYLTCLQDAAEKHSVAVHAYVLMKNHVHLLMTPSKAMAIARVFQAVGRLYVRYINKTYRRSGTLWEGRYKASLVDVDEYLLACYRYIKLNPVRAGMVDRSEAYRWSSARHNLGISSDRVVSFHDRYLSLGNDGALRTKNYRTFLESGIEWGELNKIRMADTEGGVLGNDRFRVQIEEMLGRSLSAKVRGPKAKSK